MKEKLSKIQYTLDQLFEIITKDPEVGDNPIIEGDLELIIDRESENQLHSIHIKHGGYSISLHNISTISISDIQKNGRVVLKMPHFDSLVFTDDIYKIFGV